MIRTFEVFQTAPVLVRTGEQVRIPVDVVCALSDATPCEGATATLSVVENGTWTDFSGAAQSQVLFDVTAPSTRAVAGAATSGRVDYQVRAQAGGSTAYLTETNATPPSLQYYVAENMPTVQVPAIAFGDTVAGTEVLYLPWVCEEWTHRDDLYRSDVEECGSHH